MTVGELCEAPKHRRGRENSSQKFHTAIFKFRLFITVTEDVTKETDGVKLWITYPIDQNLCLNISSTTYTAL